MNSKTGSHENYVYLEHSHHVLAVIANKVAAGPQNLGSSIKTELVRREGFLISVLRDETSPYGEFKGFCI